MNSNNDVMGECKYFLLCDWPWVSSFSALFYSICERLAVETTAGALNTLTDHFLLA